MIVITCTGFPTRNLYFDGCNICNSSKSNNIFIPIYFYILTYLLSKFNFIQKIRNFSMNLFKKNLITLYYNK